MMIIKEFREKKHESQAEGDPSEMGRPHRGARKITSHGGSFHNEVLPIREGGPFHVFRSIRLEKCLHPH